MRDERKYSHIFNGDFDYGRWEKPVKSLNKKDVPSFLTKKRQLDYKRKYG